MGLVSLTLPSVGQLNSTEDPKINSALTALQNVINGNLDTANIATNGVGTAEIADTSVTIPKLAAGTGSRLLGFLNADPAGLVLGNAVTKLMNSTLALTATHTRTTAVAVALWGALNSGGATTTLKVEIELDAVAQGQMPPGIATVAAGQFMTYMAAQQFTVTAASHSWNVRATQGANATQLVNAGYGALLIFEQY